MTSYKEAGVDIDAGNALVTAIGPMAGSTRRSGSMDALGGFGGLFDMAATGYQDPILVSATDGVGTKLKLAIEMNHHHTVGIDLVAMCVNDLIVQGAEPLFFLDYVATGKLDPAKTATIIQGIAEGCTQAGCALIGGETAEMPSMYGADDYDLAGFAVGAVERDAILPNHRTMQPGDTIIGLSSSGIHSNGFSLVRHIVRKKKLNWSSPAPFDSTGNTLGEALLMPTIIYIKQLLPLIQEGLLKGLAHITGGGLVENIPRILPETLSATIKQHSWQRPSVFDWLQQAGNIDDAEMLRTFNNGIGMVLIVAEDDTESIMAALSHGISTPAIIGSLTDKPGRRVEITS